jgi:hypothetical protein
MKESPSDTRIRLRSYGATKREVTSPKLVEEQEDIQYPISLRPSSYAGQATQQPISNEIQEERPTSNVQHPMTNERIPLRHSHPPSFLRRDKARGHLP